MKNKETPQNNLVDAINQIKMSHPSFNLNNGISGPEIVDIIAFCNDKEYLNLPESNFNLWLPQKIILKTFYMGTRGNENLKLTQDEWQWLYDNEKDEDRDGVLYEKNIREVIKKLLKKEKEPFNFTELHLCVGRRGTKCRNQDDKICTTDGSITFREMCDRINGGEKIGICTYDPVTWKRSITYDIKAQDNGLVTCYEIETDRGIKETSSWNHPYYIWRNGDKVPRFIQMSEIMPGDKIAVANCTELFGKDKIGVNRAALLGHLQGDGGITHRVGYTTASPTMLSDFTRIIKSEFDGHIVKKTENGSQKYDYVVVKESGRFCQNGSKKNEVKEWLKEIKCFGKKSIDKDVPDCIYRGSKKEVVAFLSRLFGCDGYAYVSNKIYKNRKLLDAHIGYCSSSRKLIDGVRHLLLKFGIHGNINGQITKCNGKKFISWRLKIKRKECIEKFAKEINIFSKEETVARVLDSVSNKAEAKSEFDSLPKSIWNYINDVIKIKRISNSDVVGKHGRGHNERLRKQYSPSRSKILSYGQFTKDKFLIDMGSSDIRWDEVKSVHNVGKKYTIDLEIKNTHIIGGDIVSHNTILSSIISAYEAYKLLKIGGGDPHRFYNIPEDEDIAIINVALSQNQAGRLFSHIEARLRNSTFFQNRIANCTTTEIRLFTDKDIEKNNRNKNKGAKIDIKGSVVIVCGHSNPDTLRGYSAILILFDELAFYDESGKTPGSAFYNALEPSTKKFKKFGDGRLVEISSPNNSVGIFYDLFKSAKNNDHILSYQLPTWCLNQDISYESLQEERQRNPDGFPVEYGGQWAKGGIFGKYFEEGLIARCIRTDLSPHMRPLPNFNYYLHVDPANGGDRYVALLVAKEYYVNRGRRRVRVRLANIWIWEPQPGVGLYFNMIDKDVLKICSTYHPMAVTYDQWNSIQSIQLLRSHGVRTIQTSFNRAFKNKIYQNLKDMMGFQPNPELWLYDDGRLISEMKYLRYRPTMRGISLTTDKHGDIKTDDIVDCLAGAAAMASENIQMALPLPVVVNTGWR